MAERRMICKKIVDTDTFTDMPITTRLLYYELNWRADDDGFISSPKKIIRAAGCSDDDLKILIAKQFVIPFESGIILIKDWKLHNYIAKDRYHPTIYADEKEQIITTDSGSYTKCIQGVYNPMTQVRLGKVSLGKDRLDNSPADTEEDNEPITDKKKSKKKELKPIIEKIPYGSQMNVLLTTEEYHRLTSEFPDADAAIEFLSKYMVEKNYKTASANLCIRRWVLDAVDKQVSKKLNTFQNKQQPQYKTQAERIFDL